MFSMDNTNLTRSSHLYEWHQERINNWLPYFDAIANELVTTFKPSLVLDVGCSDGLLLHSFWKLGVKGYGVDISKDPLSYASEEIRSNIILLNIEKEKLPFKDNTFNLITILEVLEHLHEHDRILSEMYRVLKPNGLVLMSSPLESKALRVVNGLLSKKNPLSKTGGEAKDQEIHDYELCNFAPHINVHPKRFWINEFESKGFRYVEDFKRTHKKLIKEIIASHQPKERVAKFLTKFGVIGRKIRLVLAYHLWSSTLLFKREI